MSTQISKKDAPTNEKLMAQQLSEQYQLAVGGLWEVVKFGAMMIHLRGAMSTCGHNATHGPQTKGQGVEGWLKDNCPEISRPTAYRFMAIAEGLREEVKLGVKVDLLNLLTADHKDLEPKLLKKRSDIQDLLEGRSQRQLLLMFAEPKSGGEGGANLLNKWLRENHPALEGTRQVKLPPEVKKEWEQFLRDRDHEKYGAEGKAVHQATQWWNEILTELHLERTTDKRFLRVDLHTLKRISASLLDLKRTIDDTIAKG